MDGIEACTRNVDFKRGSEKERKRESCIEARRRLRCEGRKFRRGGQICKALDLRGRASHLIRRRFYSPRCPNPDKPSAIREAAPLSSTSTPHPPCVRENFILLLKMSCRGQGGGGECIYLIKVDDKKKGGGTGRRGRGVGYTVIRT